MNDSYFDIFENDTTLKVPQRLTKEKPRTEIRDEFFEHGTLHEAIIPYGFSYSKLPKEPKCDAKKYKFELDIFQKLSISSIERDESVVVSAHTSCGKTVVAEYAIAQAIRNRQRVVYTSPIKALSNQKYRELQEEFQDVGLMTGDVTINPEASCLVMTTEILRNMLYRGSEVTREVRWIIFDEIHYMRDKERGVVWEETIILLPRHVRMIFLSATIPNAREFTEWISYISEQIVHIVYTEKRVIPLIHYFQTDELYLVKDQKFHVNNFKKAVENPVKRAVIDKAIVSVLDKVNVPAVVFSFSRKECESYAIKISKDFLNKDEKETVRSIFNSAIESLRAEDRKISIIERMLPLLERGIGIHHSGLLPIIKEIVEILFQESLIKVLFATETFSIGLNMPAKTVIFTSLRKFDGVVRRLLTPGEYIQMSGRAGRRGLDDKGVVISILTEEMAVSEAKKVFSSTSDKLFSAFRLTYNMVLNLMRVESLNPMYVLSRSFFHFQAYKSALEEKQKLMNQICEINSQVNDKVSVDKKVSVDNKVPVDKKVPVDEESIKKRLIKEREDNNKKDSNKMADCKRVEEDSDSTTDSDEKIKELFKSSVEVADVSENIEIATFPPTELSDLFVKREELLCRRNKALSETYRDYLRCKGRVVDILVPRMGLPLMLKNCIVKSVSDRFLSAYVLTNKGIECREYPVECVCCIYDIRCKVDVKVFNKKFKKIEYNDPLNQEIEETENRIQEIVPSADLHLCLICKSPARSCLVGCVHARSGNEILDAAVDHIKNLIDHENIQEKIGHLNKLNEIYHMSECKRMISVLRRLEYIDETAVLIKGKMASEISTADELVLTEMIFNSSFSELPLIEIVALLSCTICEEKNSADFSISKENEKIYDLLVSAVKKICAAMNECGIPVTEESYLKKFSCELMDVVRMWMSGYTFIQVCESTSVFEGNIIRTFKRLEELLRQLSNAAIVIGNSDLVNLFGQGIFLIKRDIVFANSLYL